MRYLSAKSAERTIRSLFDWMISTPAFIFEMLTLLLDKGAPTRTLVTEHFFRFDKKAQYIGTNESYIIFDKNEHAFDYIIYNQKYDVLFPDVRYTEATIAKYIDAFDRMRNLIIASDHRDELKFVYTTQCAPFEGALTIDGRQIITDEPTYLLKISDLISKHRKNHKIIIFDTLGHEIIKSTNIILINIKAEKH